MKWIIGIVVGLGLVIAGGGLSAAEEGKDPIVYKGKVYYKFEPPAVTEEGQAAPEVRKDGEGIGEKGKTAEKESGEVQKEDDAKDVAVGDGDASKKSSSCPLCRARRGAQKK